MYDAIARVEDNNRQLSEEAQRLQHQLEVIREVLKDHDIDQAKLRLTQLEDISLLRSASPKKSRRGDHSAGSLLDPENASSSSSSDLSECRPSK